MDAETLKALRGSIAKWEAIVAGTGEDRGMDNCPLCYLFAGEEDDYGGGCAGCPVRINASTSGCHLTPYDDWSALNIKGGHTVYDRTKHGWKAHNDTLKAAAQSELAFLRSLLPPDAAS